MLKLSVNKNMKCSSCQIEKSDTDFYKSAKQNRLTYCKECHKKYSRERLRIYKNLCKEYKGGKCKICGYNRCQDALDFHHLDSTTKEYGIAKSSKSFKTKKSELDKCILICSNCHRELHAGLISLDKIGPTTLP